MAARQTNKGTSNGNHISSDEDRDDRRTSRAILLRFTGGKDKKVKVSNWPEWLEYATSSLTQKFGDQADYLLKTGKKFAFTETWEEARPKGKISQDTLQSLEASFWKQRMFDEKTLKHDEKKLMHALLGTLSTESKDLIETHDQYELAIEQNNPVRLFKVIKEMHLTKIDGASPSLKVIDKLKLIKQWNGWVMNSSMELLDYNKEFKAWLHNLEAWDVEGEARPRTLLQAATQVPERFSTGVSVPEDPILGLQGRGQV